jgi:pectin methylesterase-like acyl-CoA thioesterase
MAAHAGSNLPFSENFDGATTASFRTAAYRALPDDPAIPMYHALGGASAIQIVDGALSFIGARFTIGNTQPTVVSTAAGAPPGIFDLSQTYTVSFCVLQASGVGNLQLYVDNNTTGAANSPWGQASRLINLPASGIAARTVVSVTSSVGSANSFLYLRTESGATVSLDNFRVDAGSTPTASCPAPGQASITLDPPALTWTAQAGSAPYTVNVAALAANGSPDTFSVVSSAPAIVSLAVNGTQVALSPLAEGLASITFSSGSDPSVSVALQATVLAEPTTIYNLAGVVQPAALATGVHLDTRLQLQFDSPPTLGTGGSIRILRMSDDALIDTLPLTGDVDVLGFPGQDRVRVVNRSALRIQGSRVTLFPHSHVLAPETEYYVVVDNGVFNGTALNGTAFNGMGRTSGWRFTTGPTPAAGALIRVDDDGPAHFRTVQRAIDHAVANFPGGDPVRIEIADGNYEELLYLRGKANLTLRGDSRDGVHIHYLNSEARNPGSGTSRVPGAGPANGGRAVWLIENADGLRIEQLSLRNTTLRSAAPSQAETLYFNSGDGSHRLVAERAAFYSEQDTVQLKAYAWFYRSLIEGNVDFIWGGNRVSLFEESEIRSVGDTTNAANGGYVLQARTVEASDKGFVFLNSRLTRGPGPGPQASVPPDGASYLARSGGSPTYFDNVVFVNNRMGPHIATIGWAGAGINGQPAPNPAVPTATSGWREFGSTTLMGEPIDLSLRQTGFPLSAEEVAAEFATRALVFRAYAGGQGWNPEPGFGDALFANGFEAD